MRRQAESTDGDLPETLTDATLAQARCTGKKSRSVDVQPAPIVRRSRSPADIAVFGSSDSDSDADQTEAILKQLEDRDVQKET